MDLSEETYEDKIGAIQEAWVEKIKDLNSKMKSLTTINDLLNVIYSERQNACDYCFGFMNMLSKLNKIYKTEYAKKYTYYKTQSQLRFTTESAISNQIEGDLYDTKEKIDLVESNIKFFQETVKTIDGMIYGVNSKIRIYELVNGIKK